MLQKLFFSVVAVVAAPVIARGCPEDLYICPNGQAVGRDPNDNCKFFPCREAGSATTAPAPTPVLTPASTSSSVPVTVESNLTTHKGIIAGDILPPNYNWTAIDDAIPHTLHLLLDAAFGNYNSSAVCSPFNSTLIAAEKASVATNDTTALYHVVMTVNCNNLTNVFVLEVTEDKEGMFLSQCGHRENGTMRNWLTIQNEMTKCQTPLERAAFLAQPLNHTAHSSPVNEATLMQNVKEFFTAPEMPVLGAAVVVVLAVLVIAVVVVKRSRQRQSVDRSVLAEVEAAHENHHRKQEEEKKDEDAPDTNPLESTTANKKEDKEELTSIKL
ncbi:hypothetical protein THRCLA_06394 [Thraustotheca clavata]|uniref:Secreted protein n=1 Tax=Thraustotheca clavata TaxID=74557 RepID=A0A1V9ZP85_9STRA|nr:hypothetical protein THRCLA_06394 [Thraustotheca clavata]